MRLRQTVTFLMLLSWFTVACQSVPTATLYPTYTPYPTYTLYPTYTPISTIAAAEIEKLVWPTGPRDDVIPFEDAADFLGEEITVEGTVMRTHNSGEAVFLNFSPDSEAFTAVIFPDDWPKFPAPPEELFYGKLTRIQGVVEEYKGTPEIIIREPWQIEVALTLGQPIMTTCDCTQSVALHPAQTKTFSGTVTPAATEGYVLPTTETIEPTKPSTKLPIIPWEDAMAYVGQNVTVKGRVIETYNSEKVVFLNFDEDYRHAFKVVIFPDIWPLFPEPPEDYYKGKTIQVTGQIEIYQNAPEIIVDQLEQIEIVE